MSQERLDLDQRMTDIGALVDSRLGQLVPADDVPPEKLHQAIRYSLLAPGKRLRPVLTVLTAEMLGGSPNLALDPACALEMVHAASLILDDLPFMDNAAMRRGRETNHRVFGEDIAALSSVALLNQAYWVLAEARKLEAPMRLLLVDLLAKTIGHEGIVAGQAHDLATVAGGSSDLSDVERVAGQKTATLFVLGAEMGARIAKMPEGSIPAIRTFASNLGLCFQVLDDFADRHGCPTFFGKDVGQDVHKATFVSILGTERALVAAERFASEAVKALDAIGPAALQLRGLTDSLFRRVDRIATRG